MIDFKDDSVFHDTQTAVGDADIEEIGDCNYGARGGCRGRSLLFGPVRHGCRNGQWRITTWRITELRVSFRTGNLLPQLDRHGSSRGGPVAGVSFQTGRKKIPKIFFSFLSGNLLPQMDRHGSSCGGPVAGVSFRTGRKKIP